MLYMTWDINIYIYTFETVKASFLKVVIYIYNVTYLIYVIYNITYLMYVIYDIKYQ